MVIMDADRFGVSQLHQLRGRVGRGRHEGLCLLVTESPEGSPARQRLDAVAATLDGFALSRLDLEQRREGDVLGAAQAGRKSSLRLLTLLSDEKLIAAARQEAIDLIEADPALAGQPALAAAAAALMHRAEYRKGRSVGRGQRGDQDHRGTAGGRRLAYRPGRARPTSDRARGCSPQ
jgi:ATP-dependent DNA helicase RecG